MESDMGEFDCSKWKRNQGLDSLPTTRAKAQWLLRALRGAEAPLFHVAASVLQFFKTVKLEAFQDALRSRSEDVPAFCLVVEWSCCGPYRSCDPSVAGEGPYDKLKAGPRHIAQSRYS
jgi:hypothetical protein